MIEKYGDIFDSDASYIGHGVNCCGVMGAGIAKQFRERFPHNYNNYRAVCQSGSLTPGNFMVVPEQRENGATVLVVNFASQEKPGADASYEWLFSSLYRFAVKASREITLNLYGHRVAIPEIGCGIGGLDFNLAAKVIQLVEELVPSIEFEVWHYKKG